MKLRHLFALTLAGAVLFAACGGDDDDDSGDTGAKDEATQGSGGTSDATKASADPTKSSGDATKPAASATAEDAASIFDKLAAQGTAKTYQASYDMEINASGTTQKGTAIIASKAPKLATKITFSQGEIKGSFVIITDGKDTIVCNDFGFGGQCNKSAGVDSSLNGAGIDLAKTIKEARSNSDVKELAKRTIASRASRCFEAKDKGTGTVSTFCLDEKDSIMTYMEIGGVTKLTANTISSTVDDKLFDPPFPVK